AEQVEALLGDGSAFAVRIRYVRQPRADGSADAVPRALPARARPPTLVTRAGPVFARGTFEPFLAGSGGTAAGAGAPRRGEPPPAPRVAHACSGSRGLPGVPLWGLGPELVPHLEDLPGPPYELAEAFGRAQDVRGVVVAGTRDLTHPVDLIRENFPYLTP